jgi:chemotaxis protein CheZ
MEAMESAEEANGKLREQITDPAQVALLDQITTNTNRVFEACAFQDITGQRVNKVARSITYVEERVNALINLFGAEQMAEVEVVIPPEQEKTADEKLMSGPQTDDSGLSQDARLFVWIAPLSHPQGGRNPARIAPPRPSR